MRPEPSDEFFERVAERLKALADATRLKILHALEDCELCVSDILAVVGGSQANVSKHLQLLHGAGFVTRRKEGLYVYYGLAGEDVFRLCDIMCGRLAAEAEGRRKVLAGR